jgi:hypothetical protein
MRARPLKLTAFPALVFAFAAATALAANIGDAAADVGDAGAARDAAGAPRSPEAPHDAGSQISKIPPDPPPMSERFQWVYDLRWDRGEIYLLEVHKVDMGGPHVTPRMMGRFALELFEGPTLIERVRFDFPMLGAGDLDAGARNTPRFEPKLKTRIGVLFPATNRGTKLELWDRAKDTRVALPWPPKEGPVTPDAGAQAQAQTL